MHQSTGVPRDCYAVLSFYLGDKSSIPPYTGTFTWFAPKPILSRDVSRFNGIQMRAWHLGDLPPGVRVYLQISPTRLIQSYDGYFEHDFTDDMRNDQSSGPFTIPFEAFVPSSQTRTQGFHVLDKSLLSKVYQISIRIQGQKGRVSQGKVAFSDVRFY